MDWSERNWVAGVRQRIETADESQLPRLIEQLARSETHGCNQLADLLAHPGAAVRIQAAGRIRLLLDEWKTAPAGDSSVRAAALARRIARGGTQAEIPQELVARLLDWPIDTNSIDAREFFADCERLAERMAPRVAGLPDLPQPGAKRNVPEPQPPSVGVPSETAPAVPAPRILEEMPPEITAETPAPLEELQAPDRLQPELPMSDEGRARPLPQSEPPERLMQPSDRQPLKDWDTRTDREVMRELHAEDSEQVRAAARELRRRGYQTHHLPIARSLTHPDPAVRRDLAAALPRLPDIDWRRWVTPLLSDEDPSVRLAAEAVIHAGDAPRRLR